MTEIRIKHKGLMVLNIEQSKETLVQSKDVSYNE